MKKEIIGTISLALLLSMGACTRNKNATAEETVSTTSATKGVVEPATPTLDSNKNYSAVIKTGKGEIRVALFAKEAPLSVSNFIQLAEKNFYDKLTFHRVEPGFVIQGGDPEGTGRGGPGYTVKAEIGKPHNKGALAWARLPDTDPMGNPINPEKRSSGSQFYITLEATPFLDGEYTVFGQTVSGMDVVQKIAVGDVIQDVTIETK